MRQLAIDALNAWVEQCGFREFLEGELIPDALKKETPNLRTEVGFNYSCF